MHASPSAGAAAVALRRISETERGERARRAAAGALVLRAAGLGGADAFTLRRASAEVAALPRSAERSILARVLRVTGEEPDGARLAPPLVSYACELERTRRLPEANAAISVALEHDPGSGATALHAARLARRLGERERALALYCAARELDGGSGSIARLAAVGEAVVSPEPERCLGGAIRRALGGGDAEAAAVGLEERAVVRRAAGDLPGAARDLWGAAARFRDPVDRARAAHALAGALLALRDADGAREALLVALAWGDEPQREHARARLHTLSRDLGDRVGMRRWRSSRRPALVSLAAYGAGAPPRRSCAGRLRAWREALGERRC
jgi:tetratricopeptide (TPR) repeat protein